MCVPRLRLFGLAALATLVPTAQAQEPAGTLIGLKLRPEATLRPYTPPGEVPRPVYVEADRMEGNPQENVELEGNVELRQRAQVVTSDWMLYDVPEDELYAIGNVKLYQRGSVLQGTKARIDLDSETGFVEDPRYLVGQTGGYGEGTRLDLEGPGLFKFENATYTTCGPSSQDWVFDTGTLSLDRDAEIGVARNATFFFKGTPLAYTPYIEFPLTGERKSGFLTPLWGTSQSSGFEVTVPYYWNIAPNMDYTFYPRYMSERGVQFGNEFRYLNPSFQGTARGEYMPDDKKLGTDRWAYSWRHTQTFSPEWTGFLLLQRVSDNTYFRDLSSRVGLTSIVNLPSEGWVRYASGWWSVMGRVQTWQTLQDPGAPVIPPYRQLPQIVFNGTELDAVSGADVNVMGSFNYFGTTLNSQIEGSRFIVYPSVSLPLQNSYAFLTPKIGVNFTQYSLNQPAIDVNPTVTNSSSVNRTLPIASVDSGLIFERDTVFPFQDREVVQTLEPRLYYLYIPTNTEQNSFPVFDTALATYNFTQLFSENQFVGGDRINNANQMTAAVSTRLLDPKDGSEIVRATIGNRYYFSRQEVTLPGVPASSTNASNFLALLSGRINPYWSGDVSWEYSPTTTSTARAYANVRYQPRPGQVVNIGYRYIQQQPGLGTASNQETSQIEFSAQWPFTSNLSALTRVNYSIAGGGLLEGIAGFEYTTACWAFRAVAQRFVTSATTSNTLFFAQFELTGLSSIGSSFFNILNRYIPGYARGTGTTAFQDQYYLAQ
ncbi:MAG TPA: LPS-assembly protein LptD [Burkholderiales bacterium]|nr:LPS-assembly protein LptD [Burkholderiales bacterium]